MTAEVTLRPLREGDAVQAAALEKESFSAPWSEKSILDALHREEAAYLGAFTGDELLGYGGVWLAADTGEITQIAVFPSHRRQGVGLAILKALEREAKERGCKWLYLEVRRSNLAARALYEKQDFQAVGVRKNFYSKPVEDAFVMEKELK